MSKEKSKPSTDEKVKYIIQFITEHQNDYTRCADAHKAFMAEHGKVSYVHFNRKFRELCPHLKPKKKIRTLRPNTSTPEPAPKNQELKDKKQRIQYFHRVLRDSEMLLSRSIEANDDKESIDYYRDIRDRDRKAIVDCYEDLLSYYEEKIPDDIKEIETQLHTENIRNGEELERMINNHANPLISETDEEEEDSEGTLEENISTTLQTAAGIMSKKSKSKKDEVDLEPEEEFVNEDDSND